MKFKQSFTVSFDYEVNFVRGIWSTEQVLFKECIGPDARFVVVWDEGFLSQWPQIQAQFQTYLETHGLSDRLGGELVLSGGEAVKNDAQNVEQLLNLMDNGAIDRHSYLIAIGGGALLDLAGYAAGICHRGVRIIRIPTTVLSQNDSGVGVKTSVNWSGKKNFLGTFTPPAHVICDTQFLTTLAQEDWRGGMSEAIKVALLKSPVFFQWIVSKQESLNNRDLASMEILVKECAKYHLEHIAKSGDPFEMGSSRPLDFGHWSAHKLEQITHHAINHGEAVGAGIALDVTYAYLKGMLKQEDWHKIIQLLNGLEFDIMPEALGGKAGLNPAIKSGLEEFRQHLGGQLTIMLLEGIGQGIEVHEIDTPLLDQAAQLLTDFKAQHAALAG